MNTRKLRIARILRAVGIDTALLALEKVAKSPYVRAVNYHDVPPDRAADFESQLRFYARHFTPVDYGELTALQAGEWTPPKPGLILSFDDGPRSHAEVVAPLLEKYGFKGWFMVPGGFIDTTPTDQNDYAQAHAIAHANFNYGEERIAMTWDDAQSLSRHHVVGCHTWDHTRLSASLPHSELESQIDDAKRRLETRLSAPVPVFAWVGGEEASYSRAAASLIAAAGFSHSFMTNHQVIRPDTPSLQLQRSNIEATDPEEVMRFQLTGLMDLIYGAKRRRVNKLTAT